MSKDADVSGCKEVFTQCKEMTWVFTIIFVCFGRGKEGLFPSKGEVCEQRYIACMFKMTMQEILI